MWQDKIRRRGEKQAAQTGRLTDTGKAIEVGTPTCVKFSTCKLRCERVQQEKWYPAAR